MRILFLTQRLPYAPNRGDRIRAYHLLRLLRTFADVSVVSFVHDDHEEGQAPALAHLAHAVPVRLHGRWNRLKAVPALPGRTPLTHLLLSASGMHAAIQHEVRTRPDIILAQGSGMARFCTEPPLAGLPFVLDMVDADSAKWAALAERTSNPFMAWIFRREARLLATFERRITALARCTTVVNQREHDVLRGIAPEGRIEVVPIGADLAALTPPGPPAASTDVVFCGVMNYAPNEEGALWLAAAIWPLVVHARPDARLLIVGANPTPRVQALANAALGITVTGSVPEVTPYLWGAAVSVAPLLTARGVQTKVLEAVAAGLPTVVTTAVAEGLPASVLPACLVANEPEAFARAIVERLGLGPNVRRALAGCADLSKLTWEAQLAPMRRILTEAASRGR